MPTNPTTPCGIYAIRHVPSGKLYIGAAVDFVRRRRAHWRDLKRGEHSNTLLQEAWVQHGPDQFVFEVLEVVENRDDLVRAEQEYMDRFRTWEKETGYNIDPVARPAMGLNLAGKKKSEETRARMRTAQRNRSPEHRAALAESNKVRTPEARAKQVAALRGRVASDETRDKLRKKAAERAAKKAAIAAWLAAHRIPGLGD